MKVFLPLVTTAKIKWCCLSGQGCYQKEKMFHFPYVLLCKSSRSTYKALVIIFPHPQMQLVQPLLLIEDRFFYNL